MTKTTKKIAALLLAAGAVFALSACGDPMQKFDDASTNTVNDDAADTGTMPDGFSNFASKCDHGNRVYTLYHGTSAYGGIAVVPNDPTCA